jgi:MIP family channel proteins
MESTNYNETSTPTNTKQSHGITNVVQSPITQHNTQDYGSPRHNVRNLESQGGSLMTHPDNNNINNTEHKKFICPSKIGRACISELFGMYIFITLSLGNIAILVLYPESNMTWAGVSISWGLNLMMGIYASNHNSYSHLNPGVTLAAYIEQIIELKELVYYTLAQLVGAFLAAATVYGIYFNNIDKIGNDMKATSIFVTYRQNSITTTAAFFTEFLGSTLLICGIFVFINKTETKSVAPVYIGTLLSALTFSFGYQTAFAFNAARDLGPRIFMSVVGYSPFNYRDSYFWVPIVANYAGGVAGILMYKFLFKKQIN